MNPMTIIITAVIIIAAALILTMERDDHNHWDDNA